MKLQLVIAVAGILAFSPSGFSAEATNVIAAGTNTAPFVYPGKGLAQHPFVYCNESSKLVTVIRDGKVAWTYDIEKGELDDITLLSNGNMLMARSRCITEVTPDKQVVWNYDAPTNTQLHSAQAIGLDKVLFMQNGNPAKFILMNIKTGKMEMEHEMTTGFPGDPKKIHGQFRHVRMTAAGTYLVPHLDMGKVIEYDKDWKVIWTCEAKSPWAAVRLKNGNTLISGNAGGWVREVNPKCETVWEVTKTELPGITLRTVQEVDRLANGNTVICSWAGKNPVSLIEVTPDKKVVWVPEGIAASCVQLLDEPGVPEIPGDLQR